MFTTDTALCSLTVPTSMRPLATPPHTIPAEPVGEIVRVLVADDFPLVRDANAAALDRRDGLEVVGVATDGAEAVEMARELRPDVTVLDLRMPNMSGLAALAQLTSELRQTRVLLLTACEEPKTLVEAISLGAAGFLTKRVTGDELADAVLRVGRGEWVFSPSLTGPLLRGLARQLSPEEAPPPAVLTTTERDMLRRVADGKTDQQIGLEFYMSTRTVQSHLL